MRRAVLAAALLLAGCGGGDPGGDRATYQRNGDAICSDYRVAIAKLGRPDRISDLGPYITRAMPILTRTVGRIEKLDPPGELKDAYASFRDSARQTVDRATAMRRAAEQADANEVQRLLKEASAASRRRQGLARAAGLDACAAL